MALSKHEKQISTRPYIVVFENNNEVSRRSFTKKEYAKAFVEQHQSAYNIYGIYDYNTQQEVEYEYGGLLADHNLRHSLFFEYIDQHFPKVSQAESDERKKIYFTRLVIQYYDKRFAQIGAAIVAAILLNYFGYRVSSWLGTILAAFFYSGGTLGYLVLWKVQTWGGTSKPEQVNEYLLISSYILGTFFTVLNLTIFQ